MDQYMKNLTNKSFVRLLTTIAVLTLSLALISGCSNAKSETSENIPVEESQESITQEYSWSGVTVTNDIVDAKLRNFGDTFVYFGLGDDAEKLMSIEYAVSEELLEQFPNLSDLEPGNGKDFINMYIRCYQNGETKSIQNYLAERKFPSEFRNEMVNKKFNNYRQIETRTEGEITYSFYELGDEYYGFLLLGYDSATNKGFTILVPVVGNSNLKLQRIAEQIMLAVFRTTNFDPAEATVDSAKLKDMILSEEEQRATEAEKSRESEKNQKKAQEEAKKDKLITETDGKTVYQVTATSSSIHFTGQFDGTGNFIVKVLDSNQKLSTLVCNEIGSWKLDSSASVVPGNQYYIVIECSSGTWSVSWTGTGGQ